MRECGRGVFIYREHHLAVGEDRVIDISLLEIDRKDVRNPSLAVDDVRSPTELLDGLEHSSCKEDGPFTIVLEELSLFVAVNALAVEIILIINEIHLHSRRGNGCYLDYQRPVNVVDDDVHTRKTDHFVKLVLPLVDAAVSWHK